MIYTVGHTALYEQRLADAAAGGPPAVKLGRQTLEHGDFYAGGTVWQTQAEAQAWLDAHPDKPWTVWGIQADWDTDTTESLSGESWHDLLTDSPIVAVDQ